MPRATVDEVASNTPQQTPDIRQKRHQRQVATDLIVPIVGKMGVEIGLLVQAGSELVASYGRTAYAERLGYLGDKYITRDTIVWSAFAANLPINNLSHAAPGPQHGLSAGVGGAVSTLPRSRLDSAGWTPPELSGTIAGTPLRETVSEPGRRCSIGLHGHA